MVTSIALSLSLSLSLKSLLKVWEPGWKKVTARHLGIYTSDVQPFYLRELRLHITIFYGSHNVDFIMNNQVFTCY
jgi:hypothetical protein